jgi:hypothetical protein
VASSSDSSSLLSCCLLSAVTVTCHLPLLAAGCWLLLLPVTESLLLLLPTACHCPRCPRPRPTTLPISAPYYILRCHYYYQDAGCMVLVPGAGCWVYLVYRPIFRVLACVIAQLLVRCGAALGAGAGLPTAGHWALCKQLLLTAAAAGRGSRFTPRCLAVCASTKQGSLIRQKWA